MHIYIYISAKGRKTSVLQEVPTSGAGGENERGTNRPEGLYRPLHQSYRAYGREPRVEWQSCYWVQEESVLLCCAIVAAPALGHKQRCPGSSSNH